MQPSTRSHTSLGFVSEGEGFDRLREDFQYSLCVHSISFNVITLSNSSYQWKMERQQEGGGERLGKQINNQIVDKRLEDDERYTQFSGPITAIRQRPIPPRNSFSHWQTNSAIFIIPFPPLFCYAQHDHYHTFMASSWKSNTHATHCHWAYDAADNYAQYRNIERLSAKSTVSSQK